MEEGRGQEVTPTERTQLVTSQETIDGNKSAMLNFYLTVGIAEVFGVVAVGVTVIWMAHYRGGFAWDGSAKEFNYHPIFMVLGFVFLYGNGMLVYRVFRNSEKLTVKIIHACILISSLIFAVVGLKAVFDFHNGPAKIPNMYSLHSWAGLTTTLLFSFQWVFGFMAFLFPKFHESYRAAYLNIHRYFGHLIIILAIATSLMGITEKLIFSVKNYKDFPAEGILANMLGMLLVIFGGLIIHITTKPSYQRLSDSGQVYSKIE